jgi:hypothetical protein
MKRITLGLFVLLFSFTVQASLTVNIIPNQPAYQVGDTVLLAVTLSGAPKIHGGGLNVNFNPNVINAQSVVLDNTWGFASRTGVINNTAGRISDILFASFSTVEGELPVAIIQLSVIGYGDSGFNVTESAKNPFSDANGQVVSFSVNNLFGFNTQVVEQVTEETTEQVVEQQTTTEATTITITPPANEVAQQAITETATQPANQVTEQTTTASSNDSNTAFSNNLGFSLPNATASKQQVTDNSQNDRQFYLPSGDSKGIPVTVTDDNERESQANNVKYSDASGSNISDNRYAQESKAVDESLLASATVTDMQSEQTEAGETQWSADTENIEAGSSTGLLTFVIALAVIFVGFIVFKVFIKKEY